MSETLTFDNFRPNADKTQRIYDIGLRPGIDESGVIPEIAVVFGHILSKNPEVKNLGNLIGVVGQAKELQLNIEKVREILGTDNDAVEIARGWVERSGLLVPVSQEYMTTKPFEGNIDLVFITGGVRNWMYRRADELEEVSKRMGVGVVYLVGGNRQMNTAEGPDVEEGMTEADYLETVIAKRIESLGIEANTVHANTDVGEEVMAAAAKVIENDVFARTAKIANISNAGTWIQNGGQLLRALRLEYPQFNAGGNQFISISDSFELGTGVEPTSTHQNPFSALGAIARNGQELARKH